MKKPQFQFWTVWLDQNVFMLQGVKSKERNRRYWFWISNKHAWPIVTLDLTKTCFRFQRKISLMLQQVFSLMLPWRKRINMVALGIPLEHVWECAQRSFIATLSEVANLRFFPKSRSLLVAFEVSNLQYYVNYLHAFPWARGWWRVVNARGAMG